MPPKHRAALRKRRQAYEGNRLDERRRLLPPGRHVASEFESKLVGAGDD